MKRFKAESQGNLKSIWNVLDTRTNTFVKFCLTGPDARYEVVKEAQRLNKDKRFKKYGVHQQN